MTDRERKDYYLMRIRKILWSKLFGIPWHGIRRLEEELKIIMWNNPKDWTDTFMKEEVVPLLNKRGIKIEIEGL